MTKHEYREMFNIFSYYMKMNKFLEIAGISQANFSRFLKSDVYDDLISLEKLDALLTVVNEVWTSFDLKGDKSNG